MLKANSPMVFCSGLSIAIATTNDTLFTWTVSPSGLPMLTTPLKDQTACQPSLYCQSHTMFHAEMDQLLLSPILCHFCVHLFPEAVPLTFSPSWTYVLQFCQQPSLTYGLRVRQRKCIMSCYPQFSISSPQISLITNFHIAHILTAQSLLLLTQITNADTLPWGLLYSPCSLSIHAKLGPANHPNMWDT